MIYTSVSDVEGEMKQCCLTLRMRTDQFSQVGPTTDHRRVYKPTVVQDMLATCSGLDMRSEIFRVRVRISVRGQEEEGVV